MVYNVGEKICIAPLALTPRRIFTAYRRAGLRAYGGYRHIIRHRCVVLSWLARIFIKSMARRGVARKQTA